MLGHFASFGRGAEFQYVGSQWLFGEGNRLDPIRVRRHWNPGAYPGFERLSEHGVRSQQGLPSSLSSLCAGLGGPGETRLEYPGASVAHVDKSGERFGQADIYRIRGDLLLLSDPGEGKAEDCYHRSLGIAKQQNAKSWELRTSMRLSHLWQKQGRIQEAKELLAGIYGWFTEGFDTPDLVDAKALLEELA